MLYTGITANPEQRIWNHTAGRARVVTQQYHCLKLLYYELSDRIETAIVRESHLKNRKRTWKPTWVRRENLDYRDVAADWSAGKELEATWELLNLPVGDSGSSPE